MNLRVKYFNPKLQFKKCVRCKKTYPRDEDHFYKLNHRTTKGSYKYYSYCITCEKDRKVEWRKQDVESGNKKRRQQKYLSTEKGYFKELWQSCRKSTHGCLFRNYEEFFECWEDQKKIYGTQCPYLGIEMTRIKGLNKGGRRHKATNTNISKDRILSTLPYGRDNLMFVSWQANNMKGNITPFIARKYLEFVDQRGIIKHMMEIEDNKILKEHGDYFEEVKSKKKVIKLLNHADLHATDEDDKSFFAKELDKLRKSLSKDEMKQFYEVAYASHKKEKQQKEEARQLIKLKHEKKNETQ